MANQNKRLRGSLLWLLCATSFGFVVVQLDVTIVNVALPQIGSHLHAGVAGLQWVVDAYTLSFAALLISAGVIGDRFGSRRAYLAGFAIFTVASIICGLAPSYWRSDRRSRSARRGRCAAGSHFAGDPDAFIR